MARVNRPNGGGRLSVAIEAAILLLIPLGVFAAGTTWYVPRQRDEAAAMWRDNLSEQALLLAWSIDQFVTDHMNDAATVASFPSVKAVCSSAALAGSPGGVADMDPRLDEILGEFGRRQSLSRVLVLDLDGRPVAGRESNPALDPECQEDLHAVQRTGRPAVGIHRHAGGRMALSFSFPVVATQDGAIVGWVLVESDPALWLNPILERRPWGLESAETFISRVLSDRVEYLSPVRFDPTPPLDLWRPLYDDAGRPRAAAAQESETEAVSYRGTPVLTASCPLSVAPWSVVVQVDRDEALASPLAAAHAAVVNRALLVALGSAGLGALRWNAHRARVAAAAARKARLTSLMENAGDAILVVDTEGVILHTNKRAEEFYGKQADMLRGRHVVRDLRVESEQQIGGEHFRAVLDRGWAFFETVHRHRDGSLLPVEVNSRLVEEEGERLVVSVVRDIRDRRALEARNRHLEETLRTLIAVNEVCLQAPTEVALFREACEAVIREGRFVLAWVGISEPGGGVQVAGSAGPELGYLDAIQVRWDDSPLGLGPTGTALREGRSVVLNRSSAESAMGPWLAVAERHGIAASMAVPLREEGRVVASLNIYASDEDTFTPEVVALMERLGANLSSASVALHAQAMRRDSEELFRTAFDNAPIGMALSTPDGSFIDVNRALSTMLGYEAEEMLALTLESTTDPADAAPLGAAIRDLLAGEAESLRFDQRFRAKDGRAVWTSAGMTLLRDPDGRPRRFVTQVQDISDRVAAEEELRHLNVELERRVESRTEELTTSNRELEAFSYSISHDLRAPLRAIDGFGRILLEDHAARLDAEGRRLLRVVGDSAQSMGRLIDALLNFSRAGRLELKRYRVDMRTLADSVFHELCPPENRASVDLRLANIPDAWADASLIRQVWVNLIGNALKFSASRERRTIVISAFPEKTGTVYTVGDNGVGFDMRHVDKLFGVFQRLHSREEFEGTGVGLALVQRIINRHGGRIWAEGVPDGGATFSFLLPDEREAAP